MLPRHRLDAGPHAPTDHRCPTSRRRAGGLLALAGSAILAATACAPATGREIRVGLLGTLHGDYSLASGIPSLQGAQLAVDELNAAGGILVAGRRHRFVLVERHHEMRPDAAASAARASVNLDRVDLLIGPQLSDPALAAGAVAEESGVPMISPMSSNPATTAGRRFVFRMAFLDDFQGTMLARYARDDLHARTAAVLYDVANPYSVGIARLFRETFVARGGTVVAAETFTSDQFEGFGPQLRRIAGARPEVLLLPNRPRVAIAQVRESRRAGVTARLLGSDTWDLASMSPMPEADSSIVVHQWHYDLPTPRTEAFVAAFRAAFGGPPRATAALTYDAVWLAADAMQRAGSLDGDAVADAIAATAHFEGASGTLRFAGSHDPQRSGVLSEIARGTHRLLRVIGAGP